MAETSKSSRKKLTVIILFCVILCISITTILILTLPASAQEKKEKRIKDKVSGEFEGLDTVKLSGEIDGLNGKLENYELQDKDGNALGRMTVDAATEEMEAIVCNQEETSYGDPKLSNEELRAIALDYLAKWDRAMDKDYYLVSEELLPFINVSADKHSYVYQATWIRKVGDVAVNDDGCAISIDPYNGKVISCNFPKQKRTEAEAIIDSASTISQQEAIDIARKGCPSLEEWVQRTKIPEKDATEKVDAEKVIQSSISSNPLIWRVTIYYEVYAKGAEHNHDTLIDSQAYKLDVDARSGEIVTTSMTQ